MTSRFLNKSLQRALLFSVGLVGGTMNLSQEELRKKSKDKMLTFTSLMHAPPIAACSVSHELNPRPAERETNTQRRLNREPRLKSKVVVITGGEKFQCLGHHCRCVCSIYSSYLLYIWQNFVTKQAEVWDKRLPYDLCKKEHLSSYWTLRSATKLLRKLQN